MYRFIIGNKWKLISNQQFCNSLIVNNRANIVYYSTSTKNGNNNGNNKVNRNIFDEEDDEDDEDVNEEERLKLEERKKYVFIKPKKLFQREKVKWTEKDIELIIQNERSKKKEEKVRNIFEEDDGEEEEERRIKQNEQRLKDMGYNLAEDIGETDDLASIKNDREFAKLLTELFRNKRTGQMDLDEDDIKEIQRMLLNDSLSSLTLILSIGKMVIARRLQTAYEASLKIFGFRPEGSINLGLKYLRKPLIGQHLVNYYPKPLLSREMIGNSDEKGFIKEETRERDLQRGKVQVKKGAGKQALKRKK
ncbi:hypothetical protein DLAC_07913 [Tieghemostelium lacteum]|uniref:Uncharacterized protein n=1 Tax=Tieghemostelium lacteum TaxID=361077 RepID=A0A151ZAQ0_TIELA|nr:hypothetical protein DLAC_07913 [Tieghemostelium lacteum]|eukprot:KYQ91015.1 hypothetical protein DLAC_07913 [Tieghemostelium lacteum]